MYLYMYCKLIGKKWMDMETDKDIYTAIGIVTEQEHEQKWKRNRNRIATGTGTCIIHVHVLKCNTYMQM
jgi:hypothetical protein